MNDAEATVEEVRITSRYTLYGKLRSVQQDSPTILLLHGLGFHSFEYDELATLLAAAGYNSLALDYRGHGRSEGPRGTWVLKELVEDAARAVDFLSERRARSLGVFGNSLGAIVGVHLAARDPRVRSLVASGCPTRVADFASTPFRQALLNLLLALGRIIPLRVSVNHFISYRLILRDPSLIARVSADPLITDARRFAPSTYQDMFRWDALEAIRTVAVPLLVLYGDHDAFQPTTQSTLLYEAARGEKAIRALPTGHVPDLENAELLAPVLVEWFGRTLRMPANGAAVAEGPMNDVARQYLQPTTLVDFEEPLVMAKARELTKGTTSRAEAVRRIYHFVRDEIPYTFTHNLQKASDVMSEHRGQCNTKTTLTIALLRAIGIPARYHCGRVAKSMFAGVIPRWAFELTPDQIPGHCWPEVLLDSKWTAIENVVDLALYRAIRCKMQDDNQTESVGCGLAKDNFQECWDGKTEVLMQQGALVEDDGTFADADQYLEAAEAFLNPLKRWLSRRFVKPAMNRKFDELRHYRRKT